MSGKELAQEFSSFVNNYGGSEKKEEFVNAFCNQHRTLQQSMFGLILQVIEKVASDEYRTDGRNEASHKVAKQIVKGFREQYKKDLQASDPLFWNEERAENQANAYSISTLPLI